MYKYHYVPVALVVKVEEDQDPDAFAEQMLSTLVSLEPKGLAGATLITNVEACPASDLWWDQNQTLVPADVRGMYTIKEESIG